MPRAILIAGPTASGKTALALRLCKEARGVAINADSMQVYRELRIVTARPTALEEASAPHRLFGHVDSAQNYSVGRWLLDLASALEEARSLGRTPIVVGGTGMYFKAALRGLAEIPPVPQEVRARMRDFAQGRTPQMLHAELARRDPATAERLRPSDPQRILRALEVMEATGRPLASFQSAPGKPLLEASDCACFFLAPPRDELYARIDARFDRMMEEGALEEARALRDLGLDPTLPAMRAHGVPHLLNHLAGGISLEQAVAQGKLDTRHYVKRQFTFARHQLPEFEPLDAKQAEALRI